MSDNLAIDVQGMTKKFGDRTVVNDIALQVREGEIFGFLGPNGSGKTTFIRMLCGLLRADDGRGTCLGHDVIRESEAIKRQVGYMTQRFSFYEDLSIRENLDFVARVYGIKDRAQAVRESIEGLGLTGRQEQLAGELSGGWKQRLALAACMIHRPKLLLLDEPTAGVDPKARREFWEQIHTLAGSGISVLVSTHYMDEAERCHRLAYIAYGRLLATGTVDEVIALQSLTSYSVTGPDLASLSRTLAKEPGIDQVTQFGNTLHVSGHDAQALQSAAARMGEGSQHHWEKVAPGLEDVFVSLMNRGEDNFQ